MDLLISGPGRCLLLGVMSLLLLGGIRCDKILYAGDQCGGPGIDGECEAGLVCVAESLESEIAFCEALNECEIFGCNEESGECVCNTSSNCLASFNFTSLEECQDNIKESACDPAECPHVWCSLVLQYTPEGECCPVCPPLPVVHFPTVNIPPTCVEEDGSHYSDGDTWQRSPCVTCTCEAGLALCSTVQCAAPSCASPVLLPGHCCPMCPSYSVLPSLVFIQPHPPSTVCEEDGVVYKDGESWYPDKSNPCKRCFCDEGETLCVYRQCGVPECDNPVYSEDTCCPTCPEKERERAVRSVHSSSPHLQTADAISEGNMAPQYDDTPSPTTEPPTQDSSSCRASNGRMWSNGDTWCPIPHILARCDSGTARYARHCPRVSCDRPIKGKIGTCDCPYCPEEKKQVQVAAILEMPYGEYEANRNSVRELMVSLMSAANLELVSVESSEYSTIQTHLVVTVQSESNELSEEAALQSILPEIAWPASALMTLGTITEYPPVHFGGSKRSIRSAEAYSESVDSSNSPTTIIAVTASVLVAVVGVIAIAALVTRAWRRHHLPKTIVV